MTSICASSQLDQIYESPDLINKHAEKCLKEKRHCLEVSDGIF